jgi:hypothetical protein
MQLIPLMAVPSQTIQPTLGGQRTRINIYHRTTGLYCDVFLNDVIVVGGVVCHQNSLIVRDFYRGFAGDLMIVDQQGNDDPQWNGLGIRWVLYWLEPWQIYPP